MLYQTEGASLLKRELDAAGFEVHQLSTLDATLPVDDFVLLPSPPEELTLRLRRALWRRTGIDTANTLRAGDLLIDLANYKVFVEGQAVNLTFKEFELLRFLMTNRGKVFTREALLNRVWGYEYEISWRRIG
jgi:DNA-binding response OmpR family regulator